MSLPHPNNDASPGDFFYPGSPTVVFSDAPGAGGSRAVEFGEDGFSSAVNRGFYASLKNIEHVYNRIAVNLAAPSFVSWTPAGGSGSSYTLAGIDLFTGHADVYLPETQEIRDSLISVLDSNYNELIDPTSGDKIVVREIRNTGDSASVVGTEFYSAGAKIRFKRVHPVTGVSGPNYTIPDGTAVKFSVGIKINLENLYPSTTGKYLQDILFRGFTRSSSEVHASSFLRDGSRAMLANIDMNTYSIENVSDVISPSGSNLNVRGKESLILQAEGTSEATGFIGFIDKSTGGWPILFNYSDSAVYAPDFINESVLGALNSHGWQTKGMVGAHFLSGSLSFNDVTREITWTDLVYCSNGEKKTVSAAGAGSGVVVPNNAFRHVVLAGEGTPALSIKEYLAAGDVPLYRVYYDSGVPGFTSKERLYKTFSGRSGMLEVTVGSKPGCDFSNLQDALNYLAYVGLNSIFQGDPTIKIVDEVSCSSTVVVYADVKIIGAGPYSRIITTSNSATNGINCNNKLVQIENLKLKHGSSSANGGVLFFNPGSRSIFRNIYIEKSSSGKSYDYVCKTDSACSNITLDTISDAANAVRFFFYGDSDCSDVTIKNCNLTFADSSLPTANAYIEMLGTGLNIHNCKFTNFSNYVDFIYTNSGLIIDGSYFQASSAVDKSIILFHKDYSVGGDYVAKIVNSSFANYHSAIALYNSYFVALNLNASITITGNRFMGGIYSALHAGLHPTTLSKSSSIVFSNNAVFGASGVTLSNCKNVIISSNVFSGSAYGVIQTAGGVRVVIDSNIINGWLEEVDADLPAIDLINGNNEYDSYSIQKNTFINTRNSGTPPCIHVGVMNCTIEGNKFQCEVIDGSSYIPNYWITLARVKGNKVANNIFQPAHSWSVKAINDVASEVDEHGLIIENNRFERVDEDGSCIYLNNFNGTQIFNNVFTGISNVPTTGECGSGITIESNQVGASYSGNYTDIKGNTFQSINGACSGSIRTVIFAPSVSYLVNVTENSFYDCGTTYYSSGMNNEVYIIKIEGNNATILSNKFVNAKGPRGTSSNGILRVIRAGSRASIIGNYVSFYLSNNTHGTAETSAIYLSDQKLLCNVSNNHINMYGNPTAGTTNLLTGIRAAIFKSTVNGNMIDLEDANSVTTRLGIDFSEWSGGSNTLHDVSIVGNVCLGTNIYIEDASNKCIATGNRTTVGSNYGSAVTTGNSSS